ncbi:uncharacterized protein LOC135388883 [Ornithodoros turicata]|uniref:uncharacterized protein LOC135388883 n=1 Tax=Ornithodoros turicata TaxID=34597 RepID=UPI00313872B2
MASTRKQVVIMDIYNDENCNGAADDGCSPPPGLVKPSAGNHLDFVTVVSVEDSPLVQSDNYVTVLQVNDADDDNDIEEILVYRLPGERLGMALKFVGGTTPGDFVSRVFIQSINPDSPASRAQWKLSPIREGDEILQIGDTPVTATTRLDCVTLLRDAPVCIKMVVRHASGPGTDVHETKESQQVDRKKSPPPIPPRSSSSSVVSPPQRSVRQHVELFEKQQNVSVERSSSLKRPSIPPPLPPRRPKSHSCSDSEEAPFPGMSVSMRLPGWEELMRKRNGDRGDRPIQPDVYVDLLAEEERRLLESESDDTGSSVSTVIEKFSRTSTANSSFSEHTRQQSLERPPFDLEKVLSPFEQLERELDGERESSVDDDLADFVDDPGILNDGKDALCEVFGLPATIAPPESFQDMSQMALTNGNDSFDGVSSEESDESDPLEDAFRRNRIQEEKPLPEVRKDADRKHGLAEAALDSLLMPTSDRTETPDQREREHDAISENSCQACPVEEVITYVGSPDAEERHTEPVQEFTTTTVVSTVQGLSLGPQNSCSETILVTQEVQSTSVAGAAEVELLRTFALCHDQFTKDVSSDEESLQVFQSSASVVVTSAARSAVNEAEGYVESPARSFEQDNRVQECPEQEDPPAAPVLDHTKEDLQHPGDVSDTATAQDDMMPPSPTLTSSEDNVQQTEEVQQDSPKDTAVPVAKEQQSDYLSADLLDKLCQLSEEVSQQKDNVQPHAVPSLATCGSGLISKAEDEKSQTVACRVKEVDQVPEEAETCIVTETSEAVRDQMSTCDFPDEPFPSLQRLPPDGHEFPPAYTEPDFKQEELPPSPVQEAPRKKVLSSSYEDSGIFTDDPLSSLSNSEGEEKTKSVMTPVSRQGDGESRIDKNNADNALLHSPPLKQEDVQADVLSAPTTPVPAAPPKVATASEIVAPAAPQFSSPLIRSPEKRSSWSLAEATQKRYSGMLASMLETTKFGTTSKLKGLIIPDKPKVPTGSTKTLPVIVSNATCNVPKPVSSSDDEGSVKLRCERSQSVNSSALLSELPWKSELADVPKYSPAFKRRSLQVSKSVDIPQPAKPSATSQNGFQFSLSHSKPVTPVLPETPVMSPPPLSCGSSTDVRSRSNSTSSSFSSLSCSGHFSDNAKKSKADPLGRLDTMVLNGTEKVQKPTTYDTSAANASNGTAAYTQSPLLERYLSSSAYANKTNNCDAADADKSTSRHSTVNGAASPEEKPALSRHSSINGSTIHDVRNGEPPKPALSLNGDACVTKGATLPRSLADNKESSSFASIEIKTSVVKEAPIVPLRSNTARSEIPSDVRKARRASDILPLMESKFSSVDDQSWNYRTKRSYFDPSRRISSGSVSNLNLEQHPRSESKESAGEAWQKHLRAGQLGQQKTVLKKPIESVESARSFKALAQKWEQRSLESQTVVPTPNKKDIATNGKLPLPLPPRFQDASKKTTPVSNGSINGNATQDIPVKLRQTRAAVPRPASLIEERDVRRLSLDWIEPASSVYLRNSPSEKSARVYRSNRSAAPVLSVTDIKKAFEGESTKAPPRTLASLRAMRSEQQPPLPEHRRFSSIDSNDSGHSSASREQYSSMTSLASTSSLISPQELQQLIDDANQSLDEAGAAGHDIHVVILHRDSPTSGLGITLAGGSDYEAKEITVHKVIAGGLADRDGRIRKSDRILSINGKTMKGATHREAIDILKAPRQEVVLVISREGRQSVRTTPNISRASSLSSVLDVVDDTEVTTEQPQCSTPTKYETITLVKDGLGLGFTLEGGKDSPLGDRPLVIKRIFKGGAAERDGRLQIGSELIAINEQSVGAMTRTEAWNYLKKLADGALTLQVSRRTL